MMSEILTIKPNIILDWENIFDLNIKDNNSQNKIYSKDYVTFFKKVKSMLLNGYSLETIKDFLSFEIDYLNGNQQQINLLQNNKNFEKQEYPDSNCEIIQLKEELKEKNQKLKEFEDHKKRLNFLELQLKVMQLNK